jgi:hypothetical protein
LIGRGRKEVMTKDERKEFDKLMAMANIQYKQEPNTELNDLYFLLLSEYPFNSVKMAFIQVLKTIEFFPKPGNIVRLLEVNEETQIDNAFEECKKMVNFCGFHDSVVMANAIAMQVVSDMGGLQIFLEKISQESKDTYFEFKRVYKRIKEAIQNGYIPECKKLIGYNELNAHRNGAGGTHNELIWDNRVKEVTKIGGSKVLKLTEGKEKPEEKLPEYELPEGVKTIPDLIEHIKSGGIEKI